MKQTKEEKAKLLENTYNINKEILYNEYFNNQKNLKFIEKEKFIPYRCLRFLLDFYGFQLRTAHERNLIANKTMQKRLMEKYGVSNPFQLKFVKEKIYTPEINKKRYEAIKNSNIKNYGVENVWQLESVKKKCNTEEIHKKGQETKKKHFEDSEFKKKFKEKQKETLKKNYGVENVWQLESVKKKCNTEESIKKSNETKFKKGLISGLSEGEKYSYKQYCKEVSKYTEKTYKKYKTMINPLNLKRGKWLEDFQLDHIYSKIDGFKNKVHPKVIGTLSNLRMVSVSENASKNYKSLISLEDLFKLYGRELYWGDENE
ncbi:MAG: hypothetical protein LBD41_04955 [Clostridiales Family XIII bacterium]|jgi:hypothetical protein|nr:hypothetical protein [Clostridiales Family XIII bacterium]